MTNSYKSIIYIILYACAVLFFCECRNGQTAHTPEKKIYSPEYAGGFEILSRDGAESRIIRTRMPWQGADSTALDLLILRNGESVPEGFRGRVIDSAAKRIVAMSSSYIAALEIIGKVNTVVGVSGINYISNTYIRNKYKNGLSGRSRSGGNGSNGSCSGRNGSDGSRSDGSRSDGSRSNGSRSNGTWSDDERIADVGNETNVDFEKLATCSPDLVLLYGISSSSAMEEKLRLLKIPYFYMGEYLETDPLGRAEWMVALAEITGNIDKGIEQFNLVKNRYNSLKSQISKDLPRPKIMLNAPYGDAWFMSSAKSSMSALIEDAGGEYLYKSDNSNKSVPIDIETAWLLTSEADFWLNPGRVTSLAELERLCPGFANTAVMQKGQVYNCDKRRTPGGGNDFWESGHFRPDLVLEDLIKIFHPELCDDSNTDNSDGLYYYRRLE